MNQNFLRFLQCFECDGDFQIVEGLAKVSDDSEAPPSKSAILKCSQCGQEYPISGGIPRILPSNLPAEIKKTGENFGREWTHFHQPTESQKKQLIDWLDPITEEFFKDKVIVDLGCGMGRNTRFFAEHGAKWVVGVDVGCSVDQAAKNCQDLENVFILQADIGHLPLKPVFDFSFSLGVLHHLPNPRDGFKQLVSMAKPGGSVYAWVYGRENNGWVVKIIDPIRKNITSKLPLFLLRFLSWPLTLFLMIILKLIYRPINAISKNLSKYLFYNNYLFYISSFPFREIELIVYDHLTAPTAYYIPRTEFDEWFRENGLRSYEIIPHNNNSWKGIGKIPVQSSHRVHRSPLGRKK